MERKARADLRGLPADLRRGLLAETLLMLARRVDAGVSMRDAVAATREIRLGLEQLRELSPAGGADDVPDELSKKRENRIRAAGAAG